MRPLKALSLQRLSGDEQGAAAVEFALILPFLLLLYVGTIEASSLITVDRRINIISGTVGDLVARTDPTAPIDVGDLNEYFQSSEGIIFPYDPDDLEQVVSLVTVDEDGNTAVGWSCGYNGGVKRTAGEEYPLPEEMNSVARPPSGSGFVVASETHYPYLPALGLVFTEEIDLHRTSYYLPRYQEAIASPGAC